MTAQQTKHKPFPRQCHKCGQQEVRPVASPYTAEVKHDGRLHKIEIAELEIPTCQSCGERVFSRRVNNEISQALRSQLRLLSPDQILAKLRELGLSQKEMAARLGVAEATFSRWVTGSVIQSRALDNLLRTYFAFPDVRHALVGEQQDPNLGLANIESGA